MADAHLAPHQLAVRSQHHLLLCRLHSYVDFVVCLGGDGTILHASSLFQRAIPPVISFSLGSLGFLTNHTLATAEDDLRGVIYGCEDLDQCALDEEVCCSCSCDMHIPFFSLQTGLLRLFGGSALEAVQNNSRR